MNERKLFCVKCGAVVPIGQTRCPRCGTRLDFTPRTWTAVAAVLGLATTAWRLHLGTSLPLALAAGVIAAAIIRVLVVFYGRDPWRFAGADPRGLALGVLFVVIVIEVAALQPSDTGEAILDFTVVPALLVGIVYLIARTGLARYVTAPGTTRCPQCASPNSLGAHYCRYCGRDLSSLA